MILQLAVSRQREYLADATAAEFLGEGRPLAEALGTLERGVQALPMEVNPATDVALHREPARRAAACRALLSTHPPIAERIQRLAAFDAARGAVPPMGFSVADGGTTARRRAAARRAARTWSGAPNTTAWLRRRRRSTAGSTSRSRGPSMQLPERERTKHVHRLHPYLGKFVPQLVEALLDRYVAPGGRVLDPFAGSGTTLVQSLESGRDAAGVDIAGSTAS